MGASAHYSITYVRCGLVLLVFFQPFFSRVFYLGDHGTGIAVGYHSSALIDPSFHPPTHESTEQKSRSINHGQSGSSQWLVRPLVLLYERLAKHQQVPVALGKTLRKKHPTSQCSARLYTLLLMFFVNLVVKIFLTFIDRQKYSSNTLSWISAYRVSVLAFCFWIFAYSLLFLQVLGLCVVTRVPSLAPVNPYRSGR